MVPPEWLEASAHGAPSDLHLDLDALPAPVRTLYETAFGEATGHVFLAALPFAILALVLVLLIREVPLRTTLDLEVPEHDPVDEPSEAEASR